MEEDESSIVMTSPASEEEASDDSGASEDAGTDDEAALGEAQEARMPKVASKGNKAMVFLFLVMGFSLRNTVPTLWRTSKKIQ
jgi:hypothetical protein